MDQYTNRNKIYSYLIAAVNDRLCNLWGLATGDWRLGIGDWGLVMSNE